MDNFNFHILVDAKTEFTKQLCTILTPRILEGISTIYDLSVEVCDRHNDTTQYLRKFQSLLGHIPKWSQDLIDREYERIKKKAECDWLDELINAVFVSHVKVMAAIKVGSKAKNAIDIKIPNAGYFIHKCYVEVARRIWKKPYVFFHKVSSIDLQRGLGEAENIIDAAIQETIRNLLPVKAILKEYLGNNFEDDDLNEDDISKAISTQTKNNLRKIVQQELENYKAVSGSSNESIRTSETIPTAVAEIVRVDLNTVIPELPAVEKNEADLKQNDACLVSSSDPVLKELKPEPEPVLKPEPESEPELDLKGLKPVLKDLETDIKEVDLTAKTDLTRKIDTIEKKLDSDSIMELAEKVEEVDMAEIEKFLSEPTTEKKPAVKKQDTEIVFFDDL